MYIYIIIYIYTSSHHHSIRPVEPRDCLPQLFVKPTWKWKTHGSWQFHNSLKAKRSPKVCEQSKTPAYLKKESKYRGCHEIKNCRRSILNKWKTFPCVIKMNLIPCSYWDALSFCRFSTGPLTPDPIGVSDVGFMGKDRRRSRSRSRRRCRKSMDEVKI